MLEMVCKVEMLEQQLKEVSDSHSSDVLKELQVIVITLEFSVTSKRNNVRRYISGFFLVTKFFMLWSSYFKILLTKDPFS